MRKPRLVITRCPGCGQMRGVNGSTCRPSAEGTVKESK